MNSMNDERFFDLAMKVIARQATAAESAELQAALVKEPARKAELAQWQAQAGLVREVLPLVNATEAPAGELPAYARGRLQTKVRETLGRPPAQARKLHWAWRWSLVLAPATAAVVLLGVFLARPAQPVFQVAMLDITGQTRGSETNEVVLLAQHWTAAAVQNFGRSSDLEAWEKAWPAGKAPSVKVAYDRAAGEVRVMGRWRGRDFQKTFLVEHDLASTLKEADVFIQQQTK